MKIVRNTENFPDTQPQMGWEPLGGSILTCDLHLCDGFVVEITIFEEAVVLPVIINTDVKDPEGHFTLCDSFFQELCPLHVLGGSFSM